MKKVQCMIKTFLTAIVLGCIYIADLTRMIWHGTSPDRDSKPIPERGRDEGSTQPTGDDGL